MRNLAPKSLKRNLARVIKKSLDGVAEIEAAMQDGNVISTLTHGEFRANRLMGFGYHGPKKARICDIKIPVSEIERLKVSYDPRG